MKRNEILLTQEKYFALPEKSEAIRDVGEVAEVIAFSIVENPYR